MERCFWFLLDDESVIDAVMVLVISNAVTSRFISDNAAYVVTTIALSVVIYAVIEIILKNEAVYSFIYGIKNKLKRNKN